MREFGLLTPSEIEVRQAKQDDYGIDLLLYKTARTDANVLDRIVGRDNWQNDFKEVDGVLYGGIGIWNAERNEWVWKWDAGSESNMEAEKGRASDAFKRAGFKFGIGRELYTSPRIRFRISDVKLNERNKKCYDNFVVTEIGYDADECMNHLVVLDETTGKEFKWDAKGVFRPESPSPENKGSKAADDSLISKAERKLLFDLGKQIHGDGVGEAVKAVCTARGIASSADIPKAQFPEILNEVKNWKKSA